ncbi:short-chain dehydrogenase reductase sdr [Trichoderma arundinaceum]|uniref:Short-chain dehydrogenase reductase sdr n=1 Tax=Trichoderma arundinaceum TaxID=490622 RepID=A0A395NTY1_TRIAR|nr:short-chain dehydrogenase reductase sdr [Trichoderma arundinaceum]
MPSYAVTGASKGLGLEYIRQLSQSPSNTVLAIVRSPDSAALKALAQSHPNVHIIKGDVTNPQSILAAADEASKILDGKLDVFVHNSNSVDFSTMHLPPSKIPFDVEATKQFYEEPVRTAIWGGAWATNAFLPLIEKGSIKKIAHITSSMANTDVIIGAGLDYAVAYSIAKAGMNVQVAKYAAELAPKGIKTVAICPGWVDTHDGPKPPQLVEATEVMRNQFRKIDPELKVEMSAEQSVSLQLKVIEDLDAAKSGRTIQARFPEA